MNYKYVVQKFEKEKKNKPPNLFSKYIAADTLIPKNAKFPPY